MSNEIGLTTHFTNLLRTCNYVELILREEVGSGVELFFNAPKCPPRENRKLKRNEEKERTQFRTYLLNMTALPFCLHHKTLGQSNTLFLYAFHTCPEIGRANV